MSKQELMDIQYAGIIIIKPKLLSNIQRNITKSVQINLMQLT